VRPRTSITLGAGSGLVGLVLLVVESVRVLNGSTLDTLNSVLLFVGLGLLAVGGIMLVIAVVAEDEVGAEAAEADAAQAAADEAPSEAS
jgi:hypothetical protein